MSTVRELLSLNPRDAVQMLTEDLMQRSRRLITVSQHKLDKNISHGYLTAGLTLSPAHESLPFGGVSMCRNATAGCMGSCLVFAGANRFPFSKLIRVARTLLKVHHPVIFIEILEYEINGLMRRATKHGLTPAFRPNLLSDDIELGIWTAETFPGLIVYDYTKRIREVLDRKIPSNYFLTFSRSESNWKDCLEALDRGFSVTVVFESDLPKTWLGLKVVDGDVSDTRFIEAWRGVVIGLRLKGTKRARQHAIKTKFAVSLADRFGEMQ